MFEHITKAQVGIALLIASVSAVGGAVLGGKIALDRLGDKLREEADEALKTEIELTRKLIVKANKDEGFSTPEEALESLHPESAPLAVARAARALVDYQGMSKNVSEAKPDLREVAQNVFTDAAYIPAEFDYETELRRRDPERPYLITFDEFVEAGPQYEQVHFTYYSGDGVLANAQDMTIDDIEGNVGEDNLMRFGEGSEDPTVVYVRNIKLEMDIEISRSPGKYGDEVADLGEEAELRHSNDRRLRKFRPSDD